MASAVRFFAVLAAVLVAKFPAGAQPTAPPPHPVLAGVVREYKRLGLPLPPPNAQLVRINRHRYRGFDYEEPPEGTV